MYLYIQRFVLEPTFDKQTEFAFQICKNGPQGWGRVCDCSFIDIFK